MRMIVTDFYLFLKLCDKSKKLNPQRPVGNDFNQCSCLFQKKKVHRLVKDRINQK